MKLLWNAPALYTMHENRCIPELRPIELRGHYREKKFRYHGFMFSWLGRGFVRYALGFSAISKNLSRECLAACIH